jgi:hypothetical protein
LGLFLQCGPPPNTKEIIRPLKKRQPPVIIEQIKKNNLLGNIMASQTTMLKHPTKATTRDHPEVQSQFKYHGEPVAKAAHGDPLKDYEQPGPDENVHYNLWRLRPKANPKASLSLLVKGSTHGLKHDKGNDYMTVFTLNTRLEGQIPLGIESLSRKELAFEWMSTMIRPNSILARMRVNATNSDVLHVDKKTLKDLTKEGRDVAFSPAEALGNSSNKNLKIYQITNNF